MPPHLRNAVIAVEDARFYEHNGVDLKGTVRAAWSDLVARDAVQGGSTITQQLVKRVYAGRYVEGENGVTDYVIPPRTVKEKVREVLLAIKVERTFEKETILAKYLNTVYFGHGAYGIEAAAQTYFGVPARRLTVSQSATLAGILTAPEAYDPIDHPFDAKFRRDFALDRMVQYDYLEAEEADELKRQACCGIPIALQQGSDAQIEAAWGFRVLRPVRPGDLVTALRIGGRLRRWPRGDDLPRPRLSGRRRSRGRVAPPDAR